MTEPAEDGGGDRRGVVLASGSPRRRELIAQLGRTVRVVVPDVDETPLPGELPAELVRRLAVAKATATTLAAVGLDAAAHGATGSSPHATTAEPDERPGRMPQGEIVVAADTVIDLDGVPVGQPADRRVAATTLAALSGRRHRVLTGVCVQCDGAARVEVVATDVEMVTIDGALAEWYLDSGEWQGKAGAYALQGLGGRLVERIDGNVQNVIGLPMAVVARLIEAVEADTSPSEPAT